MKRQPKAISPRPMFFAKVRAGAETALDLYLYDVIGEDWFGDGAATPAKVQAAIKDAGAIASITVHLNSPGGDSFDGVAIHNILRQAKVPVNVIVEGLAASAAFTVAMAGDTIQVCDGAMMMLHNAWSIAMGDAKQLRDMADLLEKVSGTLRDIYAKRSGQPVAAVQSMMDAETWLTPDEAVAQGFATAKLDTTPEMTDAAAALAAQFDLSRFAARVPEKLKRAPKADMMPEGPPGEPKNNDMCQCDCPECRGGDCAECSDPDCDDPNCEGNDMDDRATAAMPEPPPDETKSAAARGRHLRLIEHQPGD